MKLMIGVIIFITCVQLNHASTALDVDKVKSEDLVQKHENKRLSCFCNDEICKCCAKIQVPRFKLTQTVCLEVFYEKKQLAFSMAFTVNGTSVWKSWISGRNPPPICIPIPQFPLIRLCIVMRDIQFQDGVLHVCSDLEVRVPPETTLLIISLDCIQIGRYGIIFLKPNETTLAPAINFRRKYNG